MGCVLLVGLAVPLGWYFWSFFKGVGIEPPFEEKMLTVHDELFSVHFQGRMGWAVGKYGLILKTKDGAKTWATQVSGTTKALTSVSFADARHGFAIGAGGIILATADGGRLWNLQQSGVREQLLSVQAMSPKQAFVVGAFGTILSTSDGGVTWRNHRLSWEKLIPRIIKEVGYMEPNLYAIYFITPELGWIVGEFGLVLHSRDGGQTWISQRYGDNLAQLLDVKFRDSRRGWAIGQDGVFAQTYDGGRHWLEVDIGTKQSLYGISLDGDRGVIVGEGVIFKTNNGGSSWVRWEPFPVNLSLSGVALTNRGAVAVGEMGFIRVIELEQLDQKSKKVLLPIQQG